MAADKRFPKSQGGRLLKRGDGFDPECWRTTHRLRVADAILRGMGINPTFKHEDGCGRHPDKLRNVVFGYRERVICTCGADQRGYQWPEWVTGEIFDLAYRLADEYQTEHGAHERAKASEAKQAREAVAS